LPLQPVSRANETNASSVYFMVRMLPALAALHKPTRGRSALGHGQPLAATVRWHRRAHGCTLPA
jgi:hypothetical protein